MASLGYSSSPAAARLINRTVSPGFSYLTPQISEQHPGRSFSPGYGSLPRNLSSRNTPGNFAQTRRKLVNNAIQDYLKSLNAMTRSIVLETETVEKENHCNWKKLDTASKEDLVNDHFMPADVRMQYCYEQERTASSCSFNSSWSMCSGDLVENRPMQSSDWANERQQISKNAKDLNDRSSMGNTCEDLSLSQPSLCRPCNYESVDIVQPSSFNRLHKKQLSFRPNHKQHAVTPRQGSQQNYPPSNFQVGSDGESPRTSDEDYEGIGVVAENPLGFQRSKMRSYSMRSKRAGGGIRHSANLRSSVRTNNKIKTGPDQKEIDTKLESFNQNCRPSHYHNYSTALTETNFDEEIDMPDDALLLDHITSTDKTDSHISSKSPKYMRKGTFIEPSTFLSTAVSSDNLSASDYATHGSSNLYCSHSRESLDMDSVSMAPSDMSKATNDDDEESIVDQSRMTPDSVLSLSSYSSRPRSKSGEIAVLRNRRGKRGGSHVKVATSDFADRHTQFKTNMLQKHQLDNYQISTPTTRAISPASSISSFPTQQSQQESDGNLKVPSFASNLLSKYDSIDESTSYMPHSPDHLSLISSPPNTPLTLNCSSPHSLLLRKSFSSPYHEHRESGYVSSSSESFPVTAHQ